MSTPKKVRYAVVGLGHIAQVAVLPAFQHARRNSELVALVSGDARKLKQLGRRYKVKTLCSYEQYEQLLASGEIDAVYLATPNNEHLPYARAAARAGVHVLCEKPMEIDAGRCREMIDAAREENVRLMIAYRLHFNPANLEIIDLLENGKIGEPRIFNSVFAYPVKPDNIRATPESEGGGPIFDIGIYCINAARYLFQAEPTEVFATVANREGKARLPGINETFAVTLRFPGDRLACFTCSFAAGTVTYYQVVGTQGDVRLENAYEYAGSATRFLTVKEKTVKKTYPQRDQFGAELLYFSDCVRTGREPEPGGVEGLRDLVIIDAIRESVRKGEWIQIHLKQEKARPGLRQEISLPAVREPKLVKTEAPSKKSA